MDFSYRLFFYIWLILLSIHRFDGCNVTDPSTGKFYDLSPLRKPENDGFYTHDGNYTFRINVCNRIKSINESFEGEDVSCYQTDHINKKGWICGREKIRLMIKNDQLMLIYSNGDFCDPDDRSFPRQVNILLVCKKDGTLEDLGVPIFMAENRCIYTMIWHTLAACPKAVNASPSHPGFDEVPPPSKPPGNEDRQVRSSSGWTIFFLLLFLFTGCFFIIGFMYNTYVAQEEGLDRVPCIHLFRECYSSLKRQRLTHDPVSSGYSQIPSRERLLDTTEEL